MVYMTRSVTTTSLLVLFQGRKVVKSLILSFICLLTLLLNNGTGPLLSILFLNHPIPQSLPSDPWERILRENPQTCFWTFFNPLSGTSINVLLSRSVFLPVYVPRTSPSSQTSRSSRNTFPFFGSISIPVQYTLEHPGPPYKP